MIPHAMGCPCLDCEHAIQYQPGDVFDATAPHHMVTRLDHSAAWLAHSGIRLVAFAYAEETGRLVVLISAPHWARFAGHRGFSAGLKEWTADGVTYTKEKKQ